MQLHRFTDSHRLNEQFVRQLTDILNQAIVERGRAYLVVSGGKTPRALFQKLAESSQIDWENVSITLADERWLLPEHQNSNERLVREHLLQSHAASAEFISLLADTACLKDNTALINERFLQLPTFDVVILGMGNDGHTASLFPCSKTIAEALSTDTRAVITANPENAAYQRLSLTANRLQNSRHLFLHLLGEDKLQVLHQAREGKDLQQMPIRAFLDNPKTHLQVMFAPQ